MRGFRFDRLLAGTALALVLAAGAPAYAGPESDAALSAAVPLPESAPIVPLTPADIGLAGATEPAQAAAVPEVKDPDTTAAIPAPEVKESTKDTATAPVPEVKEPAKDTAAAPAKVEPAPAVTPVVTVDQQVGDKLREMLAAKSDRLFERKTRAAVEAFYATRSFAPLWSENGAPGERARGVIAQLTNAEADGLDSADYPTPDLKSVSGPDALAEAELKLTASVLAYARHAAVGRVHYSRVSADIVYNLDPPEPAEVLGKLVAAKDARAALDGYNPQHPAYKALKAKLAEVRGSKGDTGPARLAAGPALKVGMQDARVPQLRERLGVAGDAANVTYDKALAEAVKKFQRQREISPSGSLTAATIDALNGPRHDRAADIILANLERWRWVAHDLGKTHVVVNIPEFALRVFNEGSIAWQTRIVVGKPSTPTPLLSETMKYITVNPTWNVPPSIINNEYIPVLRQDPDALSRIGLKVEQNRDGTLRIYQPPGAGNALGRIRFNFPNKFLVYQHDTPDKHLFAHDKRAYSHGCMRVQNPDKYAEVLLSLASTSQRYSADHIRKMYGTSEQQINFTTPIPVHLTYQTAFVDEAGKLVLRDDLYGRDTRVLAALKGSERKYADVAVERQQQSTSTKRQVYRMPAQNTGFSLFNIFR
jgi:murein L,D-transpeptidase YcbB/YkuD